MTADDSTLYDTFATPIGELLVAGGPAGLRTVSMQAGPRPIEAGAAWRRSPETFVTARRQLDEYFAGERTAFDLDLDPAGSPFQRRVWAQLEGIGHGETISYAELARRARHPGAARAAGSANASNPLAIVRPCHRVIGADGALRGFAGGVERKRWLLAHEGALATVEG